MWRPSMGTSSKGYRQLLATIDSELRDDNTRSLKFLCEPNLGTKKSLGNLTSGFEIFEALEKNNKLSEEKLSYLCELLHVIGRVDLASLIDPGCHHKDSQSRRVDTFRVLLFRLSEELSSEDLSRLRYLYGKVPKRVTINDGLDLFSVMLQHKAMSATSLDLLRDMLMEIDRRDLFEVIDNFIPCDHTLGHQEQLNSHVDYTEVSAVLESSCQNIDDKQMCELNIVGEEEHLDHCQLVSYPSDLDSPSVNVCSSWDRPSEAYSYSGSQLSDVEDMKDSVNLIVSMGSAQAVKHPGLAPGTPALPGDDMPTVTSLSLHDSYIPLDYYKMDADPRGICLVIDNQLFSPDTNDPEAVRNLGNRDGSDRDSDALMTSFQRLKFQVEVRKNLTDTQMIHLLKHFSSMDHRLFDCFVCCILSHGGENHVFGVNGRKVQLADITSMFRVQSCPSLVQKPKLFFMASCRGKNHQLGMSTALEEPMFHMDTPQLDFDPLDWVPNEADFLFGYSTVVNHVSYRSKSQGTFYISQLTKVLDKYAHIEDVQTLLLRVNAAVSDKIYSRMEATGHMVYKQTPAPQHTLRKQLKFL